MIKTASAFALVLLLSGCAQQTFKMNSEPVASPKKVITHHFFISGLGQKKPLMPLQSVVAPIR